MSKWRRRRLEMPTVLVRQGGGGGGGVAQVKAPGARDEGPSESRHEDAGGDVGRKGGAGQEHLAQGAAGHVEGSGGAAAARAQGGVGPVLAVLLCVALGVRQVHAARFLHVPPVWRSGLALAHQEGGRSRKLCRGAVRARGFGQGIVSGALQTQRAQGMDQVLKYTYSPRVNFPNSLIVIKLFYLIN